MGKGSRSYDIADDSFFMGSPGEVHQHLAGTFKTLSSKGFLREDADERAEQSSWRMGS